MRKATNVARENLVSIGTCIGKFTKTKRFRLHVTALDFMAPYAKVRLVSGTDPYQFPPFYRLQSDFSS